MVAAGGSYAMRIHAVYDEALFIFINPDLRIVPADGSDIQVTVTIEVDRLGAIVMVNSVLVPFVDHVLTSGSPSPSKSAVSMLKPWPAITPILCCVHSPAGFSGASNHHTAQSRHPIVRRR